MVRLSKVCRPSRVPHQGAVIHDDVPLHPAAGFGLLVVGFVPERDFFDAIGLHGLDGLGVCDEQVGEDHVLVGAGAAPDVLHRPHGQGARRFRRHKLVGMVERDGLALAAGQRLGAEYFFRRPGDPDQTVHAALDGHLTFAVDHLAGARHRHVQAQQEALGRQLALRSELLDGVEAHIWPIKKARAVAGLDSYISSRSGLKSYRPLNNFISQLYCMSDFFVAFRADIARFIKSPIAFCDIAGKQGRCDLSPNLLLISHHE